MDIRNSSVDKSGGSAARLADINSSFTPVPDGFRATKRNQRVIYSTLSEETIRHLVIEHYGFDEGVKCVFYFRGVNDVYLLSTHTKQFALRISPTNWRTGAAIAGELVTLNHLGNKGVGVALPVRRTDGTFITDIAAPEGTRKAVCFNWASGQIPKYTSRMDNLRYGIHLARIHQASEDLPIQETRPKIDMDYLLWRSIRALQPLVEVLPKVSNDLNALARRMSCQLASALPSLNDFGLCHGDVSIHNARIDSDSVVLFDFDFCGYG